MRGTEPEAREAMRVRIVETLESLNASGWCAESGHDCDGTEEVCMLRCPIQVQVQIGPAHLADVLLGLWDGNES